MPFSVITFSGTLLIFQHVSFLLCIHLRLVKNKCLSSTKFVSVA